MLSESEGRCWKPLRKRTTGRLDRIVGDRSASVKHIEERDSPNDEKYSRAVIDFNGAEITAMSYPVMNRELTFDCISVSAALSVTFSFPLHLKLSSGSTAAVSCHPRDSPYPSCSRVSHTEPHNFGARTVFGRVLRREYNSINALRWLP